MLSRIRRDSRSAPRSASSARLPFRNLVLQLLVDCGKFPGASHDAGLLQPDRDVVRGGRQNEPVGVDREVEPLRGGDEDAELTLEAHRTDATDKSMSPTFLVTIH